VTESPEPPVKLIVALMAIFIVEMVFYPPTVDYGWGFFEYWLSLLTFGLPQLPDLLEFVIRIPITACVAWLILSIAEKFSNIAGDTGVTNPAGDVLRLLLIAGVLFLVGYLFVGLVT
jgi:hypothetical protein